MHLVIQAWTGALLIYLILSALHAWILQPVPVAKGIKWTIHFSEKLKKTTSPIFELCTYILSSPFFSNSLSTFLLVWSPAFCKTYFSPHSMTTLGFPFLMVFFLRHNSGRLDLGSTLSSALLSPQGRVSQPSQSPGSGVVLCFSKMTPSTTPTGNVWFPREHSTWSSQIDSLYSYIYFSWLNISKMTLTHSHCFLPRTFS